MSWSGNGKQDLGPDMSDFGLGFSGIDFRMGTLDVVMSFFDIHFLLLLATRAYTLRFTLLLQAVSLVRRGGCLGVYS